MLELLYPHLELRDVLAHELRPCLALPIIILAAISLLCAYTLLASGFDAIASLEY